MPTTQWTNIVLVLPWHLCHTMNELGFRGYTWVIPTFRALGKSQLQHNDMHFALFSIHWWESIIWNYLSACISACLCELAGRLMASETCCVSLRRACKPSPGSEYSIVTVRKWERWKSSCPTEVGTDGHTVSYTSCCLETTNINKLHG